MTVNDALSIMTRTIDNTLEEYNQSPDSKNSDGNRIPHPLDIIDGDDKLFFLDMAIKDVALKTAPVSLIEGEGSTAPELRRVSASFYVRTPATPVEGEVLDIDDGLSYAVVFKALSFAWQGYSDFEQRSDMIVSTYDAAYRDYIKALIAGTVSSGNEAYIRFSADGNSWHDSYQQGDIYISFKRIDTDTWTSAIRFVGTDGQDCADTNFAALQDTPADYTDAGGKIVAVKADETGIEFIDPPSGGSGAEAFTDLTDTPDALVADKYVKVNANGNALELVDPPAGGGAVSRFGDNVFLSNDASGTLEVDAETYNSFYIYPNDDTTITFKKFDDDGGEVSGYFGSTYTFFLVSADPVAISFDTNETFYGDISIEPGSSSSDTNVSATILVLYYDGYTWAVVSRNVILNYEP
jgi:hypothetical protein